MIKRFIYSIFSVLLVSGFAYAGKGTIYNYNYDYGPFCINESNETCLGNGSCFASVYIVEHYPISSRDQQYQFLVIVDPNTSILQPGSNYGIQRFGLNYTGNPSDVTVSVLKGVGDNTVDTKWKLKIQYDPTTEEPYGRSFGPFGVFVYDDSTTGNNRKKPLLLHIATNVPGVDVYDFYTPNEDQYIFACHIADFYAESCRSNISSALFAMKTPPTLIELVSFNARSHGTSITLYWSTASEIDNAGFNIYRAESRDGEYSKINEALIPAQGAALVGADYTFIDTDVQLWKKYFYILEDVDTTGAQTAHIDKIISAKPRLIDFIAE